MKWGRAQGSAAEMPEAARTDSRQYPQVRGARFAEGGGRFTAMPSMTLRLEASRALLGLVAACARGNAAGGMRVEYKKAGSGTV